MRYFFSFAAALLIASSVSAQSIGIRGGVHNTDYTFEANQQFASTYDPGPTNRPSLLFGIFADLPIGDRFVLSPEVSYVGRNYGFQSGLNGFFEIDSDDRFHVNYLDLGLIGKFNVVNTEAFSAYLGAGFVYGYALNRRIYIGDAETKIGFDDDDGADRANHSLVGTVGVNLGRYVFAEGRYMRGLNTPSIMLRSETGAWRSFGLNAGVRLPFDN